MHAQNYTIPSPNYSPFGNRKMSGNKLNVKNILGIYILFPYLRV